MNSKHQCPSRRKRSSAFTTEGKINLAKRKIKHLHCLFYRIRSVVTPGLDLDQESCVARVVEHLLEHLYRLEEDVSILLEHPYLVVDAYGKKAYTIRQEAASSLDSDARADALTSHQLSSIRCSPDEFKPKSDKWLTDV